MKTVTDNKTAKMVVATKAIVKILVKFPKEIQDRLLLAAAVIATPSDEEIAK